MHREGKYYFVIVIAVVVYWFTSFVFPLDPVTKRVTATTTLIAAVAFWLQFKRAERLNESNYIMNLNNQFIGNKNMSHVEHELELYYNQYETLKGDKDRISDEEVWSIHLGLNQSRRSEECQEIINYLVYLEALAALVDQQVIHLEVIDDLFSYRFFLAVNNPVVQQNELLPYADYYQGIFKLSKRWTADHHKRGIKIPMDQFNLSKTVETWNKETVLIPLDISMARGTDKKLEIAQCLYNTDPYIYPEAFGEDAETAAKAISRIIGMDNSMLDYRNLFVARYNGQVCGVCLTSDGSGKWNKEDILARIGTELLPDRLMDGFNHASEDYFSKFYKENLDADTVEIVAFCVDEGFRRKHVGSALMSEVLRHYTGKHIMLDVLEENTAAIRLYENKGFVKIPEAFDGFAPTGLRRPKCYTMVRPAGE